MRWGQIAETVLGRMAMQSREKLLLFTGCCNHVMILQGLCKDTPQATIPLCLNTELSGF